MRGRSPASILIHGLKASHLQPQSESGKVHRHGAVGDLLQGQQNIAGSGECKNTRRALRKQNKVPVKMSPPGFQNLFNLKKRKKKEINSNNTFKNNTQMSINKLRLKPEDVDLKSNGAFNLNTSQKEIITSRGQQPKLLLSNPDGSERVI